MSAYFDSQPEADEITQMIEGFQSWFEIDLDAIGHNIDQARERTSGEIVPCVKSNAYGHGIVPVVAYMMGKGVKRVLVAKLHEALQLRGAGLDVGIICIDPLFIEAQFLTIVDLDITQTIYQPEPARRLNEAARKMGRTAGIWIKIDTGLGRIGVRWNEADDFIEDVSKLENLRIEGIFSTMSEDEELDRKQVQRMLEIESTAKSKGIDVGTKSIASSNSLFHKDYTYLDATRPGLMLMGFYPEDDDKGKGIELRQSLCWKARIEHVKWIEAGESLTYSRRFVADKRMKVGTVHVGYYDGFPRGLTNKGKIRVGDEIKPVLGTVSVNHFLVDLTDTDFQVGDIVEPISRTGENDALSVASLAGIMTYSLGNALSMLTPRVYTMNGVPVVVNMSKTGDGIIYSHHDTRL
jgi:alanine racemase